MKRSFLLLFGSILTWCLLQVNCFAYSSDPKQFITEIVNEAKVVLNSNVSKDEKAKRLSNIALKTVDIKGIGRYTLGSKRKELTPDEQKKYDKIFEKYFLKSFTSRLTDYSDPKIEVLSSEVINDWRIYTKDPNKPLIRDLIVEGLKLARTQKEEFASILSSNNNDINVLFLKLEEFINQ